MGNYIYFNKLPYDVQKYIIDMLSLLEYNKLTKMHPLMYLRLKALYHYKPTVTDGHNRLIVNQDEYKTFCKFKLHPGGRFGYYKIIDNNIIRCISKIINQYIIYLINFINYTGQYQVGFILNFVLGGLYVLILLPLYMFDYILTNHCEIR
jgi:hypothetical protein